MNRGAPIVALLALLNIHCDTRQGSSVQPNLTAQNNELRAKLEAERKKNTLEQQYIEEATKTINSVHDQLMALQPIETTLRGVERDKVESVAISPTQREDMLAAIDAVQQSLQNDMKLLEEFRTRTQNAEGKVAGLEETISKLQAVADAKSKEIAELRESFRQMSETVTSLQQTHVSDQMELEEKSAELRRLTTELTETNAQLYEVRYILGSADGLVLQGVLQETRHFFSPNGRPFPESSSQAVRVRRFART